MEEYINAGGVLLLQTHSNTGGVWAWGCINAAGVLLQMVPWHIDGVLMQRVSCCEDALKKVVSCCKEEVMQVVPCCKNALM